MTRLIDVVDQSFVVHALSTAAAAVTGKVAADFTIHYKRGATGALTSVSASNLASGTASHSDGGVFELSSTNAPGAYRVDMPDAVFASGVDIVWIFIVIAGAVPLTLEIELVGQVDVANNAISANVTRWNGTAVATPHTAGYPVITIKDGTGTGELDTDAGKVLLQTSQPGVTIPTVTALTNAPSDPSGVTTLLSRLTAGRANDLDLIADCASTASKIDTAMELDGAVYRFTTNALELAPAGGGGGGATAAEVADEVWDRARASHNDSGSMGESLNDLMAMIAIFNAITETDGGDYRFTTNALELAPTGSGATAVDVVNALLGDTSVEDGKSLRGILQAIFAVLVGVTGAPSSTRTFRNPANTIDRVTTTTPGDGSRTSVTLNVS